MDYIYEGASIECFSAQIVTRDLKYSSMIEIPKLGFCKVYTCKRNSEAVIIKESDPKTAVYYKNPHLDKGDNIKSEEIVIYINTLKKIKIEVVNYTSRHKAQELITKYPTLGNITKVFTNIPLIIDPAQIPPPKKLLQS